ncbi:hypothetical protein [Saccharopolyspora tripterygii]
MPADNSTTNRYLEVLLAFRRDALSATEAVERIRLIGRTSGPDLAPVDLNLYLDRIDAGMRLGHLNTYKDGRPSLHAIERWLRTYGRMRSVLAKELGRVYWSERMGLDLSTGWRDE